ncbi:hypothetical protein SDC9_150939 [bioreactor metagenome]|uniref:Uncharacterized protein n=1 Tax=bioreactor metagenome TaxID=1076179 RepID=A0A645EPH0_9ZZZZ
MTRARPTIFSEPIGLRLCGIAEEPFWPFAKNSSTSRVSDFCSPRISVAKRSMLVAIKAIVAIYSACRSRGRTCVEISCGLIPNFSQTYSSTNGGMFAKVPTAPLIFPASTPFAACSKRSMLRFISEYIVASFKPNVVGSACTPCVRPMQTVFLCSFALLPMISSIFCRSLRRISLACFNW